MNEFDINELCEKINKSTYDGSSVGFGKIYSFIVNKDNMGIWIDILDEIDGKINEDDFAKLFCMLWRTDTHGVNRNIAERLFRKYGRRMMSDTDNNKFSKLEDSFTVYRGEQDQLQPGVGMSWSLNRDNAKIYGSIREKNVEKKDVLAFFSSEGGAEDEIILPYT